MPDSAAAGARLSVPPGPAAPYDASVAPIDWIGSNFAAYGDIFSASVHFTTVYVTRDPRHAQHVLQRNWQNYRKGQAIKRIGLLLGPGLMVSEGALWKQQRRMIQPGFVDRAVDALTGIIAAANIALLKNWEDAARGGRAVNVTRDISTTILDIVLAAIFGADCEAVAPRFAVLADETARDLRFAQAFRALGEVVAEVAGRRRAEGRAGSDLLGIMMQARDRETGAPMRDRQLISEVLTLIVAGHETTASSLNLAWYLLSQHKQADAALARELRDLPAWGTGDLAKFTYTRQVIEEVLRLYPPGWLMTRKALGDDRLDEYAVPAGTEIYIPPYFIQRHPALWEDADRFMPERFSAERSRGRHPLATLPFSAGPRNCIGEYLARTEMQIHLMTIARRLRLHYQGGPLELEAGVNLRSRHDLMMVPELRR